MMGTAADIVTFLAFAVTIFTAVKVFFVNREVEKLTLSHLFDQRISDHLALLQETRKRILPCIREFHTTDEILQVREIVSECRANCKNLQMKVPRKSLVSLLELLSRCDRLLKRHKHLYFWKSYSGTMESRHEFSENVDFFYWSVLELIKEIEHMQKDKKVSLK